MQTLENANQTSKVVELLQNGFASQTLKHAEHLAKDYEIHNPKEVGEFLGNNLFLLDLIGEIPSQIRKYFGKKQKLVLEFFLDPEDPNWHRLHILVPTNSSVDEARTLMDKFDENWWLDNEPRSNSKIMVNLRYVK